MTFCLELLRRVLLQITNARRLPPLLRLQLSSLKSMPCYTLPPIPSRRRNIHLPHSHVHGSALVIVPFVDDLHTVLLRLPAPRIMSVLNMPIL